jgi:chromosome segregation ATPase
MQHLRTILLLGLACTPAWAQNSLDDLEQTVTKTHAEWQKLAADLELRLARMLPCDPAAITAIEDTNRASAARMAALSAYTKALADQAAKDVTMARQIQRSETAYLTSIGTERNDIDQERAMIEIQIAKLGESVRRKVSLTAAADSLKAIDGLVRERANLVTGNASSTEGALKQFEALAMTLEAREAALRKQIPALEDERTKWNGYYTARMARARTECSVTGTGAGRR